MFTVTYYPDGSTTGGLILCNTSRSIAELEVDFNHQRVITIHQLAGNVNGPALAQDLGNFRNTLTMKVRRDLDFSATAFPDPEGAFYFALTQPASFPTTGILKMQIVGVTTNQTLYMMNTGLQTLRNNFSDLGIAPAFNYTFNGGLITTTKPPGF